MVDPIQWSAVYLGEFWQILYMQNYLIIWVDLIYLKPQFQERIPLKQKYTFLGILLFLPFSKGIIFEPWILWFFFYYYYLGLMFMGFALFWFCFPFYLNLFRCIWWWNSSCTCIWLGSTEVLGAGHYPQLSCKIFFVTSVKIWVLLGLKRNKD